MNPEPSFQNQEEEAAYRSQQAIPTQASVPRIQAPAYGWTGGTANRYLSGNGGSYDTNAYLDARYGPALYDPSMVDAARASGHPKDVVGDVGKFTMSITPERSYAPYDAAKDPPPRQIGDFEGIFGGLTRLVTGFLAPDVQDTLARVPELIGELFDAPLNLLRHDLPGFGVAESFERMADTPDKELARQKIAGASPTWAHWYMSEYINSHMGDFSDAQGIPHALGMLMAPGQTPIGRLFGAMNVPYEASTRMIAGGALDWLPGVEFDRATELLNTPDDELHPLLLDIKQQFVRGDFDEDGLLDRLTSTGFGLTNDHFHGMLLSFITDPLILTSFGTGAFARMVTRGALSARAERVSAAVMRLPEGDPVRLVYAQAKAVAATRKTAFGRYANRDLQYRTIEEFIDRRKGDAAIDTLVKDAEAKLSTAQQFQVKLEGIARPANAISEALNSPFGIFGSGGAGRAVFKKFAADATDGVWKGHDSGTVVRLVDGISNPNGASEAAGYYVAQAHRGLVIEALHKQLRVTGKGESPKNMPDNINVEEYVQALDMMDNPLSSREMESFIRATRRVYVPDADPSRTPAQHATFMRRWTKVMNERAAIKFSNAAQIPIEEARQRIGKGGDDVWSFVDGLHWGRFTKDWAAARSQDGQIAGQRMDAVAGNGPKFIKAQPGVDRVARATPIGPRELTDARAAATLKLVDKALKSNKDSDIAAALASVSKYDQLRNNFFSQTKAADEHQMLLWMQRYLKQGLDEETFVQSITDRTLLDAPNLWKLLDDANARMGAGEHYEMGIGPTTDKAFMHVNDEEGNLIGYRAWIDVAADPRSVDLPNKLDNIRFRMLTPIRSEHILQENRRRFTVLGAERFGLNEADTVALWSALRKAGLRSGRTLRSFKNEELESIIREAAISDQLKTKLGGHGLARLTAQAMEGDIRMVGILPNMTGKFKSGLAGKANNSVGHVSEYIYPHVRFNISPFFMLQEYIEPYFFNILRGVKVGFKESPEDSAFRQLVFSVGGDELMAQDAMAREIRTIGVYASRQATNLNTQIGKEVAGRLGRLTQRVGIAGVASTKWMAHSNLTLERWGAMVKKMINDMEDAALKASPGTVNEWTDAWPKIQAEMQRLVDEGHIKYLDPKTDQMVVMSPRRLTDGEVARLYLEQSGITQTGRTWQTQLWDGQNPSTLGRVSGIRESNLANILGRDSGVALRADIASGVLDQWEFRGTLSRLGFDADYTRRAWDMVTGPTKTDFLDSVELTYRQARKTPLHAKLARDLMEAHLETYAVHHGISVEEAVARKFARTSQYLTPGTALPSNAYPQSVSRIITDNGGEIADAQVGREIRRVADDIASGDEVSVVDVPTPEEWRRQAVEELDDQTLFSVSNFDDELSRLVASVIEDPDDAARVFDLIRSDPERGMSLVSVLASEGGDLQTMLGTFTPSRPPSGYQDIADDLNIGEGFVGKKDWTARDVMNVERVRQQRKLPSVERDIDPSVDIEKQLPLHQMSEDIGQAISGDVAPLVAESVGRRTGLRVSSIEDSMEGRLDPGALVSRGTRFVVSGTDEQLQQAADELSILTGRSEVYVSREGTGPASLLDQAIAASRAEGSRYTLLRKVEDAYLAAGGTKAGFLADLEQHRGALHVGATAAKDRRNNYRIGSVEGEATSSTMDLSVYDEGRPAATGRTVISFEPTDSVIYTAKRIDVDAELRQELDEIVLSADEALFEMDEEAWAVNRGRYEHAAKFDPAYRYQYGLRHRGWRGATVFDRRDRATMFINDQADATTIAHETFHTWARDLDRSGKKALRDAYVASPKFKRMAVARRPVGAKLNRMAEEWASEHFEAYVASGLAPDPSLRLHPIYNAYADWGRRTGVITAGRIAAISPKLQVLFDKVTPEVHGRSMAVFDPHQFRVMETFRVSLLRAEDEGHTTTYFRRGKTFLERSVNHPFFGLYPVSYMYGKVLPELMRFLFRKPFGVDAPFAGAAMWNHVYDAMMLDMSGNTELSQMLTDNPDAVRFFQLLLPGLPNDISVNMPAWTRRVLTNALTGEPTDFGKMFTDYLGYAMSDRGSPEVIMDGMAESLRVGQGMLDSFGGKRYQSEADLANEESLREVQESVYRHQGPAAPYGGEVQ